MSDMMLTNHAELRMAQRSIPAPVLEWIVEYGRVKRVRGADSYALDKKGRKRLSRKLGRALYGRVAPLLDCYVVISDEGSVVTVAKRLRSLQEH